MSSGLGRGLFWRRPFLALNGLVAQFQCRLFLLVQALTFGAPEGSLVECSGLWVFCLEDQTEAFWWGKVRLWASGDFLSPLFGCASCSIWFPLKVWCCAAGSNRPLRYCTASFDCKVPTWRLPPVGSVAGLLAEGGEGVRAVRVAPCADAPGGDVVLGGNLGGGESALSRRGFKRVRLSRILPASEASKGF